MWRILARRGFRFVEVSRSDVLYICERTRQLIIRYRRKSGIASGALFRRIRFQNHVTEDRLGVKGAREAIRRRAGEAGVDGLPSAGTRFGWDLRSHWLRLGQQ